jgi:hypothetical protein
MLRHDEGDSLMRREIGQATALVDHSDNIARIR